MSNPKKSGHQSGINLENYIKSLVKTPKIDQSLGKNGRYDLWKRNFKKRGAVKLRLYMLVVKLIKPLMYRFRSFLLSEISSQIATLQYQTGQLLIKKDNGSVVLFGAGGHARVCFEVLVENGFVVKAVVVAEGTSGMDLFNGVQVIQGTQSVKELYEGGLQKAFVAIGSNRIRGSLVRELKEIGFELITIISKSASVSPTVGLGIGTIVMPNSVINSRTVIGDACIINSGTVIEHDCSIGAAVHVAPGSVLAGNINVGDRSFIGVGCSVLPEVNIGSDVIVGAGSTVVSDVENGLKIAGTPARAI